MANKKISELDSRASLSLSDLLAVGDPTTGYLYKITITDLKSLTGAGVISFNGRVGAVSPAEGDYTLTQLGDVIITSPSNTQLLQYNGSNWVNWTPNYLTAESDTLDSVTGRGNTTANSITVGSVSAASLSNLLGQIKTFATTGNVYIGANPASATDAGFKLDVLGTTRLNGNTTVTGVLTGSDTIRSTNGTVTVSLSYGSTAGIIGTTSNHSLEIRTNNVYRIGVSTAGVVNIANLAGTGSRIVVADAAGNLSASNVLSGYVPYSGATSSVDLGVNDISVKGIIVKGDNSTYSGALNLRMANTINTAGQGYLSVFAQTDYYYGLQWSFSGGTKTVIFTNASIPLNTQRYYTLPNADGMLALTSDLGSYVPYTGATANVNLGNYTLTTGNVWVTNSASNAQVNIQQTLTGNIINAGYTSIWTTGNNFYIGAGASSGGNSKSMYFDLSGLTNNTTRAYALPDANGTIALTSQIPSITGLVPYTGATGTLTMGTNNIEVGGASSTNYVRIQSQLGYGFISEAAGSKTLLDPDSILLTDKQNGGSLKLNLRPGGLTTGNNFTVTIPGVSGTALVAPTVISNNILKVSSAANGTMVASMLSDDGTTLTSAGATRSNLYIQATSSSYYSQLAFTNGSNGSYGGFSYNNASQYMQYEVAGSEWGRMYSNGNFRLFSSSATDNGLKLQVQGAIYSSDKIYIGTTAAYGFNINSVGNNGFYNRGGSTSSHTPFLLENSSGGTIMKVSGSGDVGIGVEPAVFNTIGPILQMGRAIFYGYSNEAAIGANFRYESGDKYINSDYGCLYQMKNGTHVFSTAPSGTAGAAMTLTARMIIRQNGNKTFNGPGGQDQMFSNSGRLSNGEYIDIDTESGGGNFQGFLIAANSYAYNAGYRTHGTYSIIGRNTTISVTTIASVNGPTGSSALSITSPSTGIIRVTNVGLYGDMIVSWRGFV